MKTQLIDIPTSSGLHLSARLDYPDTPVLATALFAHCFTCGKDIVAASRISRRLVALGVAVLRFDFSGLGASEGDFADTNFSSNIQDLVEAAEWLGRNHHPPSLLIGHSLGGTAILAAARQLPAAQAFVTIGAPSDPRHIFKLIGDHNIEEIERHGDATVMLENRPFRIRKQFLENATGHRVLNEVHALNRPLLIMHSPIDTTVHIDHATALFHAAKHPKSFVSLGSADHLISSRMDADFIADLVVAWSLRYLKDSPETEGDILQPAERSQVSVQE